MSCPRPMATPQNASLSSLGGGRLKIRVLGATTLSVVLALTCAAQTAKPKTAPAAAAASRDCRSLSAADRNLVPLSAACESVQIMHRTLPNFLCQQTTTRFTPIFSRARGSEERRADDAIADVIHATVAYEAGLSRYTDITVGGAPVSGELLDVPGAISIGEFGSELWSIFQDEAAVFDFRRATRSLEGDAENVFGFRIAAADNRWWALREGNLTVRPGMAGELWVRKDTNRVVRLDIFIDSIDRAFSADHLRLSTMFADVQFGDAGAFLLPTRSQAKLCTRSGVCDHNVTEWTNCRRFAGKARIIFEDH